MVVSRCLIGCQTSTGPCRWTRKRIIRRHCMWIVASSTTCRGSSVHHPAPSRSWSSLRLVRLPLHRWPRLRAIIRRRGPPPRPTRGPFRPSGINSSSSRGQPVVSKVTSHPPHPSSLIRQPSNNSSSSNNRNSTLRVSHQTKNPRSYFSSKKRGLIRTPSAQSQRLGCSRVVYASGWNCVEYQVMGSISFPPPTRRLSQGPFFSPSYPSRID